LIIFLSFCLKTGLKLLFSTTISVFVEECFNGSARTIIQNAFEGSSQSRHWRPPRFRRFRTREFL